VHLPLRLLSSLSLLVFGTPCSFRIRLRSPTSTLATSTLMHAGTDGRSGIEYTFVLGMNGIIASSHDS
jgi:hypothetical protein